MLGQKSPSSTLRTDAVLQIGVVRGYCFWFRIYAALVPLCFVVGRALFIPGDKSVSVLSLLIASQDGHLLGQDIILFRNDQEFGFIGIMVLT